MRAISLVQTAPYHQFEGYTGKMSRQPDLFDQSEPIDSAALLRRNEEYTKQQKAAAEKARAKAIVAPKQMPKSSGRKSY